MITLKQYQQRALAALGQYLKLARFIGPQAAFEKVVKEEPTDHIPQVYKANQALGDIPYICLRIPTGGGKTLMAAHSVSIAANNFLERDYPLTLWLTPTNMIRQQTVEALKNPNHHCRAALSNAFGLDRVAVFDIEDINNIRPQDLADKTAIIVGTIQTLRVAETNKDARKVYSHNENFEAHFKAFPNTAPGLDRGPDGQVLFSLANILHQIRPLVIVDEAHKAISGLSREMMWRINPACVIETTATPVESNVLYRVYASDLKAEEMVKLPFELTEHKNWEQAVNGAVAGRRRLAEIAAGDPDGYVRPLVLFQAENKDQSITVERLKQHLIKNEKINESEIAIATGEQKELDSLNLFDKTCPINYIITIQALKEGWDCSFAYVFCSVANIKSAVDVEQLLGRVMRMPYAQKRRLPELNQAYAHVVSSSFAAAADSMYSHLINMGFNCEEATANIIQPTLPGLGSLFDEQEPKIQPILTIELEAKPALENVSPEDMVGIQIAENESGSFTVTCVGAVSEALEAALVKAAPKEADDIKRQVAIHHVEQQRFSQPSSPSQQGKTLKIGQLKFKVFNSWEFPEPEAILMATNWSPLKYGHALSPDEFQYDENARTFIFDLDGEKMKYHEAANQEYSLFADSGAWDEGALSRWLDRHCRQDDIRQTDMLEFCRRALHSLLQGGAYDLGKLSRAKYALAAALKSKIARLRCQALNEGFQQLLFGPDREVAVDFAEPLSFPTGGYAENISAYRGAYGFKKHFYPEIRDLKSDGEEFQCARTIDSYPQVEYWVRNVDRQERSFWLPLSNGRKFYPDFVAKLAGDGDRILVIEYKGGHLATTDETLEKQNVGELWAEQSGGKYLFLMAVNKDEKGRSVAAQIKALATKQF